MFCLITLLVTLQWQPSLASFPLGHNFDRLIREWKLMQHLEICLPSDLPTTEAYFSFQLTFKFRVLILPTQNGPQLLSNFFFSFSKLNLSLGFRGRKCRKRIHWWLSLWQTNDTMKNQVRSVCSPKDKIWSHTDKLQRCRRLPLEQAKLRQILENNSEGVLIRKWFDRWYVAESLCYRLRCKINHVLISQQHEFRRGRQFFPYEYPQYPPGWIYPLPGPYMFNDRGNPSPSSSTTSTDSLPESLQFREDSSMPASTPSSSRRASSSAENKKAEDRWSEEEGKLLL